MVGFDQSAGTAMLIAMSSFRLSGCNERCFKITFINLFMSAYTIFLTLFTFAVCLGVTFLMWCGVVLLISHFSKWKKLVVAYPANLDQTLAVKKIVNAQIGYGNYNAIIILESTLQSLRMKTFFLFKMGYKPMSIPWTDLTCAQKKVPPILQWLTFTYIFTTAKLPNIQIKFDKKVGEWILEQQAKNGYGKK
jgi:hypothetical protein